MDVASVVHPRAMLMCHVPLLESAYRMEERNTMEANTTSELFESMKMQTLARFPSFVKNPRLHASEISRIYRGLKEDLQVEHGRLIKLTELLAIETAARAVRTSTPPPPVSSSPTPLEIGKAQHDALYTLFTALGAGYNRLMRIIEPHNPQLVEEGDRFCDVLIDGSAAALVRKPLGSAYGPICLSAAWLSTHSDDKKARIEDMLVEYQADDPHRKWATRSDYQEYMFGYGNLTANSRQDDAPPEGCIIL